MEPFTSPLSFKNSIAPDRCVRLVLKLAGGGDVNGYHAIGRPASKDVLPEDDQEKEQSTDRQPLSKLVVQGRFAFD
jgi:hypothetical protein